MLIESLFGTRHCFRCSRYNGDKKDKDLCPHGVYILVGNDRNKNKNKQKTVSKINTQILIESYEHVF